MTTLTTREQLKQNYILADHNYQLAYAEYMINGDFTKLKKAETAKKKAFSQLQKHIKANFK